MRSAITKGGGSADTKTAGSADAKGTAQSYVAFFPCVHGHESGELIKLHCFVASALKGTIKVTSPAIDEEIARRVIGASRYAEHDQRMALGVIASVSNPYFTGSSYELALAITDKLARYGHANEFQLIIATGRLPHSGCGSVDKVEHLETKLRVVLREAPPGSLFIIPEANIDSATETEKELLDQLDSQGVEWFSVVNIDDLKGYVWDSGHATLSGPSCSQSKWFSGLKKRVTGKRQNTRWVLSLILVVLLVIIGVMNSQFHTSINTVESNASATASVDGAVLIPQPSTQVDSNKPVDKRIESDAMLEASQKVRRLESTYIDTDPY